MVITITLAFASAAASLVGAAIRQKERDAAQKGIRMM